MIFWIVASCLFLSDQAVHLDSAWDAACGGDTSFVAARNGVGQVVWAPGEEVGVAGTSYHERAMEKLISGAPDAGDWGNEVVAVAGGRASVQTLSQASIEELSRLINGGCHDVFSFLRSTAQNANLEYDIDKYIEVYGVMIGEAVGRASVTSCAEVSSVCHDDTQQGALVRMFCPQTCGCDSLASDLVFNGARGGCPSTCPFAENYSALLEQLSCSDQEVGSVPFRSYLAGLNATLGSGDPRQRGFVAALMNRGCGGIEETRAFYGNLCLDTNVGGFKPLSYLCPITCGCIPGAAGQDVPPICPSSCR